jgi:hypothetical protein
MHPKTTNTKLVPSGNHQCKQAEHAMQTFNAHFILILAGVVNRFPLSLWCHLLELTELTLNLLCQSKVTPKISAFSHVHGPHNYMKHHLHPLAVQSKPMSNQRMAAHMTHDQMLGSASARQWNITDVFGCTSQRHGQQKLATLYFSSTNISQTQCLTSIPRGCSSTATHNCPKRKHPSR